ncbi:sel1 repeat family protein, partial [Campylobacter sp. CNRCH_2014_2849]
MKRMFMLFALCVFFCNSYAKDYFKLGFEAYENLDFYQASKYFKKGCDLGQEAACYGLGDLYHKGLGVPQSYAQSIKYHKKACELGHKNSCFNLGALFSN